MLLKAGKEKRNLTFLETSQEHHEYHEVFLVILKVKNTQRVVSFCDIDLVKEILLEIL